MSAAILSLTSSASRVFSKTLSTSFSLRRALSPSTSRFQVRSMADAATPFKKIQIQRDDTEWWGVDFEVKNHALRISQLQPGFKALIPDLYRGKVGLDVAEAQHLMEGLDWQGAVKDIHASVNCLKANGSKKVEVTGYCMGGALSIASSVLIPEVDAVFAFYGVPSSKLAHPARQSHPFRLILESLIILLGFQM